MNFIRFILIALLLIFSSACAKYEKIATVEYIKVKESPNNTKEFHGIVKAQNSADLSFQTEGKIIYFPYTKGDFVKKGQVIARLDGILYSIRKNEEEAKLKEYVVQKNKQKSYYDRLDLLHREGAISDNDWEAANYELQALTQQIKMQKEKINYLNKEIDYNIITAPFDGYISEKMSDKDFYAQVGTPVVRVINSGGVQVETMVDENVVNKLKIDDEALIKVLGNTYRGTIEHISKSNLDSGGYLVKIVIDNVSTSLKEGMSADVKLFLDEVSTAFLPLGSIFEENNQKYVYKIINVKNNIGEIQKEKIKTGQVINDKIEILDGIKDNDIVILNYGDRGNLKKVKL